MPRQRFSAVLRGYRGQAARDRYIQHLQGLGNQGAKIGTRGNRPEQIPLYIVPFALPLGPNLLVKASALRPSWDLFKGGSEINTRVKETVGGTENFIKLARYAPPRIVRRQKNAGAGSPETSELTGLRYLKYGGNSASAPFGKKTGDGGPLEVFQDIAAQNKGSSTNVSYTYIEERA